MRDILTSLQLQEVYPDKAFYRANEAVKIHISVRNNSSTFTNEKMFIRIYRLQNIIWEETRIETFDHGQSSVVCELRAPDLGIQGYGVEISLGEDIVSTSFDVLDSWSDRPRYGFLSDFYKSDEDDTRDVASMLKLHINVVQFYDWMYKHEDLVPRDDYYVDLLGRELSRKAVVNKIESCKKVGMTTLAYGAVYASSKPFYESHPEWALYTNDDKPQNLGNWFYIMNISETSPWRKHIVNEFGKAISEMAFDGIHMDTYGFPKKAYSHLGGDRILEHLDEQFESLISDTREQLLKVTETPAITFNSVSNWAIESIARSVQDAVYIEVWDPQVSYIHLYELIRRAKELSGKQVILAAYFDDFSKERQADNKQCMNGLILSMATIFASGGFHFVLGEDDRVLPDPYYVKHEPMDPVHVEEARRYMDFIVRYGNLLYASDCIDNSMTHAGGINTEYQFGGGEFCPYPKAGSVWTLIREQQGYKTIQLVNYTGMISDRWNEAKEDRPEEVRDITVQALVDEEVIGVYLASPDIDCGHSVRLDYDTVETDRGAAIRFNVPKLNIWNLIYVEVS